MILSLLLAGCPEPTPEPTWFLDCGDPACSGYDGPFDGVPLCTSEAEGDPCADEGATCDPVDDCNALLVCATEDPQDQTGGCPISRVRHKRDVRYLDPAGVADAAAQAGAMRLATWNYRWEPAGTPPHLGFLIDDVEGSVAVRPDGEHVDLYGYTSLVLAATQAQQVRLAEQEARLAAQEARIRELEARLDRLGGPPTAAR